MILECIKTVYDDNYAIFFKGEEYIVKEIDDISFLESHFGKYIIGKKDGALPISVFLTHFKLVEE